MANLLDLVDQLIGNVLEHNVFTDIKPYQQTVLQVPDNAYNGEIYADSTSGQIPESVRATLYQNNIPPSNPPDSINIQKNNDTNLNTKLLRDDIYLKSDSLNRTHEAISDLLDFHESRTHPHTDGRIIPNSIPKYDSDPPGYVNKSGKFPADHGTYPTVPPTAQNLGGDLRNWDNEGIKRNELYLNTPNYTNIPPDVHSQADNDKTLNTQLSRNDIYQKSDSLIKIPIIPSDISTQLDDIKQQNSNITEGQIRGTDGHRLGNIYDDRSPVDFLTSNGGGQFREDGFIGPLKYFDVFAIANWFKTISREFAILPRANNETNKIEKPAENITKGIQFAASQLLLATLNSGDAELGGISNQIWNPLSLPLSLVPVVTRTASSVSNITVGAVASDYETNVNATVALGTERLTLMRKGLYVKSELPHALTQVRLPDKGFVGNLTKVGKTDTLESISFGTSVEGQVDGGIQGEFAKKLGLHTNIYSSDHPYDANGAAYPLEKLEKDAIQITSANRNTTIISPPDTEFAVQTLKTSNLFDSKRFPNGGLVKDIKSSMTFIAKSRLTEQDGIRQQVDLPGNGLSALEAKIHTNENEDTALVPVNNQVPDSQLYMPFMFQDLRQGLDDFLYFRAFLKPQSIAETFTPEWNSERYFGRVDQVPIYQGTIRTINLAFDVVAWTPQDLKVMWRKLYKLQSMVYPTYDVKGFYEAGPIVRMRVGDLFAAKLSTREGVGDNVGLPGYIGSLDFAYDDGIWNTVTDFKVPRKISVTLSFIVIHNGNPGTYKYQNATFEVNAANDSVSRDERPIFGVGQFTKGEPPASPTSTKVYVNVHEIRKIFGTIRRSPSSPTTEGI